MVANSNFDKDQECLIALWSLENSPSGILWTTFDGDILFANRAFSSMAGYPDKALAGMNLLDFDLTIKPTDIGEGGHLTQLVKEGQITSISSAFKNAEGNTFPVQIVISAPKCASSGFVCFVQDVSKIIELESALSGYIEKSKARHKELKQEASKDYLTGTWLRRHFFEVVSELVEETQTSGRSLSLLMIDVDHFKEINDGYGHNAGDAVLRELVDLLIGKIRANDFLFRWGGDEFVIMMPNANLSQASKTAERLREAIQAHRFADLPGVTVSIGAAEYRQSEDVISGWMSRADFAMYRAKAEGRNGVYVASESIRK